MIRHRPATYSLRVAFPVNGAVRRLAAGAVLLVATIVPVPAPAASSSFTIGDQSVVQVWAGARSDVTIRAWSKPTIQFDTDDEAVQVQRRPIQFGTPQNPLSVTIPLLNVKVRDPVSGAVTEASLPPEDFPYASDFHAGIHDAVRIVTAPDSHVTVMVPPSVAILDVRLRGQGNMLIDGYHGGTLFAVAFGGKMTLSSVSSATFLQPAGGRLQVTDSSFDRIRVRANSAQLVFRDDSARQIEVTSMSGPIAWDNGTFAAGLARFETTYGLIALGVANDAQIEARSGDGHVFWLWDKRTPIEARGDNEASVTVGNGGPLVNVVTAHGNIFLYDNALANKRLPPGWKRIDTILHPPDALPTPPPA